MRKKYLYFKIFELRDHPREVLAFSQIEIEQIIGPVTAIDNIFQLSQHPEIKRVIEKDINLQNALTDSLPARGRHGYLWSGESLPDIFEAICKLAYIKEVFLFQQMLEPEPPFLKEKMGNMPYHEMNIYLWRVYRFWTAGFLLSRAIYISGISRHESDIDEKFKQMLDELSQAPGVLYNNDPAEMIAYNSEQTPINFSLDPRGSNHGDRRWLQALCNYISTDPDAAIFAPFCVESDLAQLSILANHNMLGIEKKPLNRLFTEANTVLITVAAEDFYTLSAEIHTKTKLIINTQQQTQTDLFMYSIEGQFLSFWNDERKRLERIGPTAFDMTFLKHVSATRFLIESNTLTKSKEINTLFLSALAITLIRAQNRKRQPAFYELFSSALKDIYIHLYLLQKIKSILPHAFGALELLSEDASQPAHNGAIDGGLVLLPDHPGQTFPANELELNAILNYAIHSGRRIAGKPPEDLARAHQIEEEIREKSGFYAKLPKVACDLLTRLELYGQKVKVAEFYRLLELHYSVLESMRDKLPRGARVTLVLPPLEIKVETDSQLIPLDTIMIEFLELDKKLSFKYIRQIVKRIHPVNSGINGVYTILLLQKI